MTAAQIRRLALYQARCGLARFFQEQDGMDRASAWEKAGERLQCSGLHYLTGSLWRDRFGVDTYCEHCYEQQLAEGVIEAGVFMQVHGPDYCDACLEGFEG